MENIRSTSGREITISPDSRSSESNQESMALGAFDGLTVTQAEHTKEFSPLKMEGERGDSISPEDNSVHSFVQVHPSTSSLGTNSSPSISLDSPVSYEEDFSDLRKSIEARSALLENKISIAQQALSSLQPESRFYECQERYIKNLQKILKAIDLPSTFYQEHQDMIADIESAVDSMIDVAEELTRYHKELITDQLAKKEREFTGAIGEATQSLCQYLDFVDLMKKGMLDDASLQLCLAKRGFSKFKALNAGEHGQKKEQELFQKASSCYATAAERKFVTGYSLAKAGDSFFGAAVMLEKKQGNFSKLYEQAAICFEKGNQRFFSQDATETMHHSQVSKYSILSGIHKLNAIHQLEKNKKSLFELYNMSSEHFQRASEKLLKATTLQEFDEIRSLTKAGESFASAAQAKEGGDGERASLHRLAALCQSNNAEAIVQSNGAAITHFELAEETLLEALESLSNEETTRLSTQLTTKYNRSLAHCHYMAGRAYLTALVEVSRLYVNVANCYSSLITELKGGRRDDDPMMQLFRSAAKYGEIAVQEVKLSDIKNDAASVSLIGSFLNLKLAAEALQRGDQELADAYERCANSHFYLAVANKPSLVEHLPLALRLGFQKEFTASQGVREYWEKVTINNHQKITELLAARNSEQSYPEEELEDKGSAI